MEEIINKGDDCHKILMETKPRLSFDESADYAAWREQIRAKFIELSGIDRCRANACPLNVKVESTEQMEGYRRIRFTFDSEAGATVPCYLLLPDDGKKTHPVAITMQGHSSGFHNSVGIVKFPADAEYQNRGQFAVQAVQRGYAALAIEQRGMGERRPNARHQRGANMCEYEAHIALMLGRTLIGERVWDISKAIDALKAAFPECDTDKVLITGNSGGGTISYYAPCFDERIKLSVPSCAFCTYRDSIMNWFHCACNFIPHAYEWFEMQDLACLISPRPILVVAGEKDEIFPLYGVKTGFATLEKIYKKAGAADNCRLFVTPMAHWWCKDLVWDEIAKETSRLGF